MFLRVAAKETRIALTILWWRTCLQAIVDLGRYGLGTKRSLDQLIDFVGIDLRNQKIIGNRCGDLDYVPFEADPDPEVEVGNPWGLAPAPLKGGWPYVPVRMNAARLNTASRDNGALPVPGAAQLQQPAASIPVTSGWALYISEHRMIVESVLLLIPVILLLLLCMCGGVGRLSGAQFSKKMEPGAQKDAHPMPPIFVGFNGVNTRHVHKSETHKDA